MTIGHGSIYNGACSLTVLTQLHELSFLVDFDFARDQTYMIPVH